MASTGTAYLDVKPDLGSFQREMGSSRMSGIGKKAGLALAAGVGVGLVALGKVVKDSLAAAQEAVELEAQTAAVIKSTGAAANISGKEITDLTTRIMGYSAVSDEAIREGANMLLTFKNIRDEAGKGNDIFTQSTEAIVDMSVAMGKDLPASAIMLGKALNDPVLGVTALGRAGVQFTEEQKEQIATLVESGKQMEAQKLILKELETQFGGSAKAVGDTKPWDKFKNSIGEVQESIGKALLPTVNDLADRLNKFVRSDEFNAWVQDLSKWLKNELPGAIENVTKFFGFLKDNVKELAVAFSGLGLLRVASGIGRLTGGLKGLGGAMAPVAIGVGTLAHLWNNERLEELRAAEVMERTRKRLMASDNSVQAAIDTLAQLPESGKNLQDYMATVEGVGDAYRTLTGRIDTSISSLKAMGHPLNAIEQANIDNLIAQGRWNDAIKMLSRLLGDARKEMKPFSDAMVKAQHEVNETGGKLDQLNRSLAGLDGKNVNIPVKTPGLTPTVNALEDLGGIIDGFVGAGITIDFSGPKGDPFMSLGAGKGSAGAIAQAAAAAVPGWQSISGYRTPAENVAVGGSPTSLHMDPRNPAHDISGSNLQSVYDWIAARYGSSVRELIYGNNAIFGGRRVPYTAGDHWDHVHVADKGGRFKGPGLVAMGAGYETFAGGLQPAKRVGDAPAGDITINQYIMGEYDPEIAADIAADKLAQLFRSNRIKGIRA